MKKLLILILSVISLTVFGQNGLVTNDGFPIYFMHGGHRGIVTTNQKDSIILINIIGQSNALGSGLITELTGNYSKYSGELSSYIFDSVNFSKINTATNNNQWPERAKNNMFGFELPLTIVLDSLFDYPVYFVKYTIGGTFLYASTTSQDWNTSHQELYWNFRMTRENALEKLSDKVIKSEYVIWYQGEKDASSLVASNQYAANLEKFIDSVNVLTDSCKFYLCRIYEKLKIGSYPYRATVRTAQYNIFKGHTNTELVNVDNYGVKTDSVHLTTASVINLGRKISFRIVDDIRSNPTADNLFARMTGETKNLRTKLIYLFNSLDNYGITDSLNLFYIFKMPTEAFANMNLLSTDYTISPINSPTFYPDSGYKCAATGSRCLNTNYNPNNDINFTRGFTTAGIFSNANIGPGLFADFGAGNGTQLIYMSICYNNNTYVYLNNGSASVSNTDNIGHFTSHIDNSIIRIYKNGSQIHSENQTNLQDIDTTIYIGARNVNGTISQYSNRCYSYFYLGKFKNISAFDAVMDTYMYSRLIF